MSERMTVKLPVKLNDAYPCQGKDAEGAYIAFDDLLDEGERVATLQVGDDQFGPFGVVVRREDGLWVVPETEADDA